MNKVFVGLAALLCIAQLCFCVEFRVDEHTSNPAVDYKFTQRHYNKRSLVESLLESKENNWEVVIKRLKKDGIEIPSLKEAILQNRKDYGHLVPTQPAIDLQSIQPCLNQFGIWMHDVENEEPYAWRMWDAWGKQEGGILEGNVRWPGHYSECLDAVGQQVKGRWCQAYHGFVYQPMTYGIPIDVTKGLCLPSVCSSEGAQYLYKTYFLENITFPPLLTVKCSDKYQWSAVDTVCTCVIAVLLLFALTALMLDLALRRRRRFWESFNHRMPAQSGKESLTLLLCPATVAFILTLSREELSEEKLRDVNFIRNADKILDSSRRRGTIPTLDGLKFISAAWIVFGHTFSSTFPGLENAIQARKRVTKDFSLLIFVNGNMAVDTFFLLSGLLVAYNGMKEMQKADGKIKIGLKYLQRYLRLTPPYAFTILFFMSLYNFFHDGLVWEDHTVMHYVSCRTNWWTNLIYINNFYPKTNSCYVLGWYLANDMQFYILSPLFLILLYRWHVIGVMAVCSTIVGGMITNGVLSFIHNIQPNTHYLVLPHLNFDYRYTLMTNFTDEYSYGDKMSMDIYNVPWSRIHVYMIGVFTGFVLYTNNGKLKIQKTVVVLGWILAASSSLAIIFGLHEHIKSRRDMDAGLAAFYNAFARPVWAACVAWLIVACSSGYGGPISTILNMKAFIPLGKLSYCIYLVHFLVHNWYLAAQDQFFHFSVINQLYLFLGTLILSIFCAFLLALFVEWPFMELNKVFLKPRSNLEKAKPIAPNQSEPNAPPKKSDLEVYNSSSYSKMGSKEDKGVPRENVPAIKNMSEETKV